MTADDNPVDEDAFQTVELIVFGKVRLKTQEMVENFISNRIAQVLNVFPTPNLFDNFLRSASFGEEAGGKLRFLSANGIAAADKQLLIVFSRMVLLLILFPWIRDSTQHPITVSTTSIEQNSKQGSSIWCFSQKKRYQANLESLVFRPLQFRDLVRRRSAYIARSRRAALHLVGRTDKFEAVDVSVVKERNLIPSQILSLYKKYYR